MDGREDPCSGYRVQGTNLEVCAVGAGDELAVRVGGGERCLQIILLGRGTVQLAAHNVHHPVGQAQCLTTERLQGLRDKAGLAGRLRACGEGSNLRCDL